MQIAVIILNYNCADKTIKLINTIVNKVELTVNIIVVDNGSIAADVNRLDCLKKEPLTIIKLTNNIGYAAGNNVGIKYAKKHHAEFIFIMNPDIYFEDDIIDKMIKCFVIRPQLGICSPVQQLSANEFSFGSRVKLGSSSCVIPIVNSDFIENDSVKIVDGVVGSCMGVRVSAMNRFGQIPEEYFLNFEETDWCMKCRRSGFDVGVALNTKIFHEVHGSIGEIGGLQDYYMRRNAVVFNLKYLTAFKKNLFIIKSVTLEILRGVRDFKRPEICPIIDGITGHDKFGHYVGKVRKVI